MSSKMYRSTFSFPGISYDSERLLLAKNFFKTIRKVSIVIKDLNNLQNIKSVDNLTDVDGINFIINDKINNENFKILDQRDGLIIIETVNYNFVIANLI